MTESLYKADFYSWTQQQAQLIRSGNLEALDLDHILEELDNMGKSEYRQFSNRLDILLMHLLKWQFQSEMRSSSWKGTIKEQRFRLRRLLKNSPGLKPEINEILSDAYEIAKISAYKETGITEDNFPDLCPWSFAKTIDDDFWPE